jgi:DnaJ domain
MGAPDFHSKFMDWRLGLVGRLAPHRGKGNLSDIQQFLLEPPRGRRVQMYDSSANINRVLVSMQLIDGTSVMAGVRLPLSGKLGDLLNNNEHFFDALGSEGEQFYLAKSQVRRIAPANPPKAGLNMNRRASDKAAFNPYNILGVTKETPSDDVRKSYLDLVKTYHPDKFANVDLPKEMREYVASMLARINLAYEHVTAAR